MGKIINLRNFRAYVNKVGGKGAPDWPIDDLLYLSIPTLAIRNLDYDETKKDRRFWALSWKGKKHTKLAFWVAGTILKQWQAFRPHPSERLLKKIGRRIPRVINRFQTSMRKLGVKTVRDLPGSGYKYNTCLFEMARAVASISSIKKASNPMVGSKLLHFMLPEFFPVWDTYWIKKKALADFKDRYDHIPVEVAQEIEKCRYTNGQTFVSAAREYASYVNLMLRDLSNTTDKDLQKIITACLREGDMEREVVEGHFQNKDISPMLFEICLLGRHC